MYMIFRGKEPRDTASCRIAKSRKPLVTMETCLILHVWWIDGRAWESDGNDRGPSAIIA